MAKTKPKLDIDALGILNDIIDLCVGNIPADNIGAGEFSTIPEVLAKLQEEPGNRNAVKAGLEYIDTLKSKVVFLEASLNQLKLLQERGIMR